MRGHWRITLWTAAGRVSPKGVSRETPPVMRRNWKKTGLQRGEVRSTGFWPASSTLAARMKNIRQAA
jgi:hypothetical protein